MSALEQIAESWSLTWSGGTASLVTKTTNHLRNCFDGWWCGQCGACCEFPFGFNVPTTDAIELLRGLQIAHTWLPKEIVFTKHGPKILVGNTPTIVTTELKTIFWCPHHSRGIDGVSRCTVMDIRKLYPHLFINCNWFDGGAGEGFTKNGRWNLRRTSNRHELCTFMVDVLFSPGQYSMFLFETAHKNYLLTGELDAIVPELKAAIIARAWYMWGWFFDAICDGYIAALKMTSDIPNLVKFVRDFGNFLKRNNLDQVLQEHLRTHQLRSRIALFRAQIKLLFWWRAGMIILESFFPFKFPRKMEYCTDEHRGMVC